mmetsp:Transcript_29782/g.75856  ORF Transcript_29782/g.75856 Transcript_29782/m.75856 type:complete len:532 (+) Transcript_29782:210-1805(+)
MSHFGAQHQAVRAATSAAPHRHCCGNTQALSTNAVTVMSRVRSVTTQRASPASRSAPKCHHHHPSSVQTTVTTTNHHQPPTTSLHPHKHFVPGAGQATAGWDAAPARPPHAWLPSWSTRAACCGSSLCTWCLQPGHGERVGQRLHLHLERLQVGTLAALHLHVLLELLELGGRGRLGGALLGDLDSAVQELGDLDKVGLPEAARGERGGAHADAARDDGALVAGHAVLVQRDGHLVQHGLHARAVDAVGLEVHQDEVVVGAARHDGVAQLLQALGHGLAVGHHLRLVRRKLLGVGHLERDRQRGDGVVVGAALQAGEHCLVNDLLELLAVENHATAGAAQRLVGGGGHNVRVLEGGGHHTGSHQAADVRHVRHEVGLVLVADLAHALVVDVAGVGRRAGDDELGPEQHGALLQRVVVDHARLLVQAVGHGLKVDRGGGHAALGGHEAVGQVAAVRQVQAHDAVVGLQQRGVHLEVGWGARQRLHIHTPLAGVQLEQLQGTLLAQKLGLINELIATVVARLGTPLRILVGHA